MKFEHIGDVSHNFNGVAGLYLVDDEYVVASAIECAPDHFGKETMIFPAMRKVMLQTGESCSLPGVMLTRRKPFEITVSNEP